MDYLPTNIIFFPHRHITIRDTNRNNVLDWTYGYARYDRPCPDAMFHMSEEEYIVLRDFVQTALSSATRLLSFDVLATDVSLTEALVDAINAHPQLRSITFLNFRQLNPLSVSFCSSSDLSRIHLHGLQLLERALDVPLRPGLLKACARTQDGPHIHELINDYFSNFPARDLTFNGLQRLKLDYPDQLATSMTTDFFTRHEHLRSVFLAISIAKFRSTLITTEGCGLAKMYSEALGEHLDHAFMFMDTEFAVDPTLERGDAASWLIKSASIVLNAEHRRALGFVLEHMPLCEYIAVHDRAEERKCGAVSLFTELRMLMHYSDPLSQSELWATLAEQADKLKHLRALTLWDFYLNDHVIDMAPDLFSVESSNGPTKVSEKLKSRVESVARRCGSLEYVAIIPYMASMYYEFCVFTAEPKEGHLLKGGEREVRVQLTVIPWKGAQKETMRRRQCLNGGL